jgi:hypothetical protein
MKKTYKPIPAWIGVDLDGTLAMWTGWRGMYRIGRPIPKMQRRVKAWIKQGKKVRIFTARMYNHDGRDLDRLQGVIGDWCVRHLGTRLEATCVKDQGMREIWDDRSVQVKFNKGVRVGRHKHAEY